MKFYGIGSKRTKNKETGETALTSVRIPLTEETRHGAVNQAQRIARRDKLTLEGVYLAANSRR